MFSVNLVECKKYHQELVETIKHLEGEKKSINKGKEYDAKAPLIPDACFEKLKTEVQLFCLIFFLL